MQGLLRGPVLQCYHNLLHSLMSSISTCVIIGLAIPGVWQLVCTNVLFVVLASAGLTARFNVAILSQPDELVSVFV
jgi:hypothetical protein